MRAPNFVLLKKPYPEEQLLVSFSGNSAESDAGDFYHKYWKGYQGRVIRKLLRPGNYRYFLEPGSEKIVLEVSKDLAMLELTLVTKAALRTDAFWYDSSVNRKRNRPRTARVVCRNSEEPQVFLGGVYLWKDHPLYGISRESINKMVEVHGEVVHAEEDFLDSWYLGFHCGHEGDMVPNYYETYKHPYRDMKYAQKQVCELWDQIMSATI